MSQLQLSTGLLAFTSEVIALIVLITLTFSMCSQAKTLAKDSLENQIYENTEVTAYQTALVIDGSLHIIVDSVLLAINRGLEFSHQYDSDKHLNAQPTLWKDQMPTTSDFPQTDRLEQDDMSLVSDSIQMVEVTYDANTPDANQISADGRTFTILDSSFVDPGNPPMIQRWFDRSSHISRLMQYSYEHWSSIAAIYIGSDFGIFSCPFEAVCDNGNYIYGNSHYHSFRRYPGKNATASYIRYPFLDNDIEVPYDPTLRPWYIAASSTPDNYHLDGPYTDAGTGKWMITFAKKESETETSPRSVIGIDILLTDLQDLVKDLSIGANGFAILLLYSKAEVTQCAQNGDSCTCQNGLVRYGYGSNDLDWSDWRRPVGDSIECTMGNFGISTSGSNRVCQCELEPYVLVYGSTAITELTKLSDIDANLLASDFTLSRANDVKGSFSYSRSGYGSYIGGFGKALDGALVVVTLAPESEALATVDKLEDDISKTESSITIIVILCTIAALIFSMLFVYKSSQEISQPLVDISNNCKIIMNAQTKENKMFDPKPITVFGLDSLYMLATEFVKLMKGMHETERRKQAEPKYPTNEFWDGLETTNAPWKVHPIHRYHITSC